MKEIAIGKTIIRKRKEKGITQDELANFIGVSKSSVSKWETGSSYPDVIFLPQLAAYFNISLDELMGYKPQMTDEEIRKTYTELLLDFAENPFDEVWERCQIIVRKYYSCFPLLYQMATLLLNYGGTLKNEKKKIASIIEANNLFVRVKTMSDDIELKQLALQCEAVCETMLENPTKVIELLENEKRYTFHPSVGSLLSESYQMLGKVKEARMTLQDSVLDDVISFIYDMVPYLAVHTDNPDYFEEICRRTLVVDDVFNIKGIFPVAMLSFYLAAAEGYVKTGKMELAVAMLKDYASLADSDIFPLTVRGDDFFYLLDEVQNEELATLSFKMVELPRDERRMKADLVEAVLENPIFSVLANNPEYKKIVEKVKRLLSRH